MSRIRRVILLVETSRAFGRDLLTGIARYSRLHGPWSFYREPGGLESPFVHLKDWNPDGLIMRDSRNVDKFLALGVPTIIAVHSRESSSIYPAIQTNSEGIGEMAAEHFLERGFVNFAYCGFDDMGWSVGRCENFCRRIDEAGYRVNVYKQPRVRSKRSWKNEQAVMAAWIDSLPKPVAVMTCNDDRSQHAAEACKLAGVHVPDEVAILGVDNDELVCNLCDPPLSSIALDAEPSGYRAAELLDKLMRGQKMKGQEIIVRPTHIVERQSTDILTLTDPDVAEAVRFIRNNARRSIQVSDVVESIALSRRVLEKRFRKLLGRSVYQEIRRVRVNLAIQLLVETNKSISEIARDLGFPGVAHISRYFHNEIGMSLSAYRKKHGLR